MHKTGICTVYVISIGLKLEINNSVDYRKSINFMYLLLWAIFHSWQNLQKNALCKIMYIFSLRYCFHYLF